MHLVDLHVLRSRRSLDLNPDLRSLAATQTQAKRTTASDLRHCATRSGFVWRISGKIIRFVTYTSVVLNRHTRVAVYQYAAIFEIACKDFMMVSQTVQELSH